MADVLPIDIVIHILSFYLYEHNGYNSRFDPVDIYGYKRNTIADKYRLPRCIFQSVAMRFECVEECCYTDVTYIDASHNFSSIDHESINRFWQRADKQYKRIKRFVNKKIKIAVCHYPDFMEANILVPPNNLQVEFDFAWTCPGTLIRCQQSLFNCNNVSKINCTYGGWIDEWDQCLANKLNLKDKLCITVRLTMRDLDEPLPMQFVPYAKSLELCGVMLGPKVERILKTVAPYIENLEMSLYREDQDWTKKFEAPKIFERLKTSELRLRYSASSNDTLTSLVHSITNSPCIKTLAVLQES